MSESFEDTTDFLIKRAEYNARIAGLHFKSNEFAKAMTLYREAYGLLKKALAGHPDDTIIQKKTEDIKQLFEAARNAYQEHSPVAEQPSEQPASEIVSEINQEETIEPPLDVKEASKKKSSKKKK
jgi:hypothetical protein